MKRPGVIWSAASLDRSHDARFITRHPRFTGGAEALGKAGKIDHGTVVRRQDDILTEKISIKS